MSVTFDSHVTNLSPIETLEKFDSLEIEEWILKWWETEKTYDLIKKAEPKAKNKRFFFSCIE